MESSMISNRLKIHLNEAKRSILTRCYYAVGMGDELEPEEIFDMSKKEILDVIYLRLSEIAGYKPELRDNAYDKLIKELLLESI